MTDQRLKDTDAPRADVFVEALATLGISHVVGLPDNTSARVFEQVEKHPTLTALTVTREGEAFGIAAGLWLGGRMPAVVVQNTGFLESGDSLRGTVVRMGVPLLCCVTYRGYAKMVGQGIDPLAAPLTRALLVRPDVDSVALITEPTLGAWGIPYDFYGGDDDTARLQTVWDRARGESRPVAILLVRDMV